MNTSSKFAVSVHILTLLAGRRFVFGADQGMNSDDIAKSVGTNPVVIRRLISLLGAEGLVASKSGPNGGSYLVKEPSATKLSQIYEIVEDGNLYHMHYSPPNQICPVGAHIKENLSTILSKAEDSFKMVLETKSLQDILEEIMSKDEHFNSMTKKELANMWDRSLAAMNEQCILTSN